MTNELIFFAQIFAVALCALVARQFGETLLCALITLQTVLANLFVTQQIHLFGWNATSSEPLAVGVALSLALLQESFGKQAARRAMIISTFCLLSFYLFAALHCLYQPSPSDEMHHSFLRILLPSFRIGAASAATYLITQLVDIALFARLRARWQGGHFPLRLFLCLLASQILDTILFGFLGLYGLVESLYEVIGISLCIKGVVIALSSLLFLRRSDDVPI